MRAAEFAAARAAPIDLAREADFSLGPARVRPSLSEVIADGHTIRLQPRVMQVLVALVRAEGEVVSRDELLASCWGGLAIGDDSINRCISRLRRLAEEEAPGSFAIETLARIGYRLSRSASADAAPARDGRWTRWRVGLAAVLALGLAAAASWLALGRLGPPRPGATIAIMAFSTAPGDGLARDFADGVADEVASTFTKADIMPAPPSGVGLTSLQRDETAARLGADFALGGLVQHAGDNLHVTVSLDDVTRHDVLWSAAFDRPAAEAQAMQEQVAVKVADVLHCTIDANSYGGDIPRDVIGLYLRACDSMDGDESAEVVRDRFRQVVARDPHIANAWADLALASALAPEDLPPALAASARQEARSAAGRALQLDPKAGGAYVALDLLMGAGRLSERQALLLKGLSGSPDSPVLNLNESALLAQAGRTAEAIAYDRRAVLLDPLLYNFSMDLASETAEAGQLALARAMTQRAARIWPDNSDVQAGRIGLEARWGDPALALALLDDPKTRPARWETPTIDRWRRFSVVRQSHDPAKVAAYSADFL